MKTRFIGKFSLEDILKNKHTQRIEEAKRVTGLKLVDEKINYDGGHSLGNSVSVEFRLFGEDKSFTPSGKYYYMLEVSEKRERFRYKINFTHDELLDMHMAIEVAKEMNLFQTDTCHKLVDVFEELSFGSYVETFLPNKRIYNLKNLNLSCTSESIELKFIDDNEEDGYMYVCYWFFDELIENKMILIKIHEAMRLFYTNKEELLISLGWTSIDGHNFYK